MPAPPVPKREAMYYATVVAAALHQVLLGTMTKALRDDNVVAQNVASGLFCVLFVALGVADRPTLLAATMLGYLVSDSASVTTTGYAVHHVVTAMLLLVSLHGEGCASIASRGRSTASSASRRSL